MDVLSPALSDRGVSVSVCGPCGVSDARVKHMPLSVKLSPSGRWRVEHDQAVWALRQVRPAVVVAGQVETAPGIRAALRAVGSHAVMAAYCARLPFSLDEHGTPCPDPRWPGCAPGWPAVLAFFTGAVACQRVLVSSVAAVRTVTEVAARIGMDLGNRLRVVAPPADPRMARGLAPANTSGELIGIYHHQTGPATRWFMRLSRMLADTTPARVRVIAPSGHSRAWLAELGGASNVEVVSDLGNRRRLRSLLAAARFAIVPPYAGAVLPMPVVDCLSMGVPVVAPRRAGLWELTDPVLRFDSVQQAAAIVHRLAVDPDFAGQASDRGGRDRRSVTCCNRGGLHGGRNGVDRRHPWVPRACGKRTRPPLPCAVIAVCC